MSYCSIYGRRTHNGRSCPRSSCWCRTTRRGILPSQTDSTRLALRTPHEVRQAACACQHDPKAAHGPYFTLTEKVGGRTRSRYVSTAQVPVVRGTSKRDRNFESTSEPIGRPASNGPMNNSVWCPPPEWRRKKRASDESRKGNRPGDRNPPRFLLCRRIGFRSRGDSRAPASVVLSRPGFGAKAQRRH